MFWSVEPLYAEDIESLAKRFQDIGSLSPSEAAAIGAARCGWEGQATSQVCLSEASLVSALLVEEPLITKVGLYSIRKTTAWQL